MSTEVISTICHIVLVCMLPDVLHQPVDPIVAFGRFTVNQQ